MKIGIYIEVAMYANLTGIGRYVVELIRWLSTMDYKNEYFLYYPKSLYIKNHGFANIDLPSNFYFRPISFPDKWHNEHPQLWWKCYLPMILLKDRMDVFHGPNHFLPYCPCKGSVLTIHDLAFLKMNVHGKSMDSMLSIWVKNALKWAKNIIAVSYNTKQDIISLGIPPDRIKVVHNGVSIIPENNIQIDRWNTLKKDLGLPSKYILHVGAIQPRKNIEFLLYAYKRLLMDFGNIEHKIVLAGPFGNAIENIRGLIEKLNITSKVVMTNYLDDWQLALIYKHADVTVLPSKYEGFGMTAVESMAYGTPVIAVKTSSLLEVCGNAALMVELDDVPQFSESLFRILTDTGLRASISDKGRQNAKLFNWKRCAEETLRSYEETYQCK